MYMIKLLSIGFYHMTFLTQKKKDYINADIAGDIQAKVAATIKSQPELPVNYFYNICGTEDSIAYGAHAAAAKLLPRLCPALEEDKNFRWQEQRGNHDFGIWNLGFYNFAKVFGGK